MDEIKYWLAFNSIDGIGSVTIMKIWNHFKSMKEAWSASSAEFYCIEGAQSHIIEKLVTNRQKINPDKLINDLENTDIKILCIIDDNYPYLLKQIYDPPVILYYRGNIDNLDFSKAVSIVGTRKPTEYGREMSYRISKELSGLGVTIVSGLAEGIDTCVHTACVEAKGKTVAVLGCGINVIYPKINKNLYKQIIDKDCGVVISEYVPDCAPEAWRFPYRNRIISGLSKATVVVEAKAKGGALITARSALEQNREVFGVPSKVDHNFNDGVHNLIQKGEARIFTSYKNFLDDLNWEKIEVKKDVEPETSFSNVCISNDKIDSEAKEVFVSHKKPEIKDDIELDKKKIIVDIDDVECLILNNIDIEPISFDLLIQKTNLKTSELLGNLTMLELKGLVSQVSGKRYKKNS